MPFHFRRGNMLYCALDRYQLILKHHKTVPLYEKCYDLKLQYILVYTIFDNILLAYTCICKYMNSIKAYTTIYLYILWYTSMIILIHDARIPDVVWRFRRLLLQIIWFVNSVVSYAISYMISYVSYDIIQCYHSSIISYMISYALTQNRDDDIIYDIIIIIFRLPIDIIHNIIVFQCVCPGPSSSCLTATLLGSLQLWSCSLWHASPAHLPRSPSTLSVHSAQPNPTCAAEGSLHPSCGLSVPATLPGGRECV